MFRWVLSGAISLIVLELVTRNTRGPEAVGGALGELAGMARNFLDPTRPAFPERSDTGSGTGSKSAGAAATGQAAGSLVGQAAAAAVSAVTSFDPNRPNLQGANP
jgi:hypothetical protein